MKTFQSIPELNEQPALVAATAFSTAGFYVLPGAGRQVFNFGPGWRFLKGEGPETVEAVEFDDSDWESVNLPHGLEILPEEASGGVNYRGPAWYRKHFTVPHDLIGKRIVLYFDGIMGKSRVYINGRLAAEHFGGYLPVVVDSADRFLKAHEENVVAVFADNSDDGSYPPGKPQNTLDFCYFGGIYRDVWLYGTNDVYITDPLIENIVAGGGVFVHYPVVSDDYAEVAVRVNIANRQSLSVDVSVKCTLLLAGSVVDESVWDLIISSISLEDASFLLKAYSPNLWSPLNPTLYEVQITVCDRFGESLDGQVHKIGIRSIEFRGEDGFYLNGKRYDGKLIGVNRHQDFGYLGNAVPHGLQWRDARKLKDAGADIVRTAHYPPSPVFMDACDELGMFLINAIPGWQFFNPEECFVERAYQDVRSMVRRDRNRPCVILWESVLNETDPPREFSQVLHNTTHEEYPFPGCYTACDQSDSGQEFYDVLYCQPIISENRSTIFCVDSEGNYTEKRSLFTREWGDQVDNFTSQISTARMPLRWGEAAQLRQARDMFQTPYEFACLEAMWEDSVQFVGGTLWCGFEHQRGYHPDPFWGGIMDVFRQPKYSYWVLKSQKDPSIEPVVFIANDLNQLSGSDFVIFTNCEEVQLTVMGEIIGRQRPPIGKARHQPIVFENVGGYIEMCNRQGGLFHANHGSVSVVAEGFINNVKVAETVVNAAGHKTRLSLSVDFNGRPLVADGSDIVTVVASIVDEKGAVKRLADDYIRFEVSGQGVLIGDEENGANPRRATWGIAPALVRATTVAGPIRVRATPLKTGDNYLLPVEINFESVAASIPSIAGSLFESPGAKASTIIDNTNTERALLDEILRLRHEIASFKNRQVDERQTAYAKAEL